MSDQYAALDTVALCSVSDSVYCDGSTYQYVELPSPTFSGKNESSAKGLPSWYKVSIGTSTVSAAATDGSAEKPASVNADAHEQNFLRIKFPILLIAFLFLESHQQQGTNHAFPHLLFHRA